MRCSACGSENRPNSRFCDHCGSPLEASCPSCGATNRPDARFCSTCGSGLAGDAPTAADTLPAAATTAAERRLVTVLFADLVGFTSLAEDRDPEAVRELLTRYFDTATDVVKLHGGTVEKFIGDAVMAVWGTPVAHEDDAERAVRAALELVSEVAALHPDLRARAGVLTGEAAVTIGATNQGMVAGDLVNTAARLQGIAEGGTVLVGEATKNAAENAVVFEPIGEHSLKGKTSPVPAWQAMRVVAARGGQGRADALEAPFVGREEELRQLKDVLHAVGRERRPRLVSITGPGGIGKSRLVWELEKYVDGVRESIYWHRGRSPSYGEGITFWALGEMVRRRSQLAEDADEAATRDRIGATLAEYVPDASDRERIGPALLTLLGVTDAPPGGRDALFPAWRMFFERIAERGTTVLVFEDLQWADPGLLDFVEHLLDWIRGLPIMVVTLARPELFDRRPDWGAGHRQVTSLALEPLRDDAVRQLLDGLVPGLPADAVAAIVGRAEGVPLYAVEMVRGLLADGLVERRGETHAVIGDVSTIRVPDSLRSLIASRLDALGAEERSLLQDGSVLGQVFSVEALAAVTGADAAVLEPRLRALVRRELLDVESDPSSPERGQYRFVQSLIREVAYATLARRDRRVRHLAVARHYEALGDEELAGALASHYLAAHQASDAGAEADAIAAQARLALGAAAARAASLGSHDQAIAHLEQALAITSDPADRAPLLDRAAVSAAAAAREDAAAYGRTAVEAYRAIGDAVATASATARLGRVLLDASLIDEARTLLAAAVPEAEALEDPTPLAETLANLARAHMRVGDNAPAVAAADRALAIAERLNLDAILAEAIENKAAALANLGRRREGLALHALALEIAGEIGDRGLELRIRNNYSSSLADDDPQRAFEMLSASAAVARDIGDRGIYYFQLSQMAGHLLASGGQWDETLGELRDAYEAATLRADRLRLRTFMGLMELARGASPDEFEADIGRIAGSDPAADDRFILFMTRGVAALHRGDLEGAFRWAREAWELHWQSPEIPTVLALRAAMRARDPALVRTAVAMVEELPHSGVMGRAFIEHARAALAAAEGRVAEAVTGFRAAQQVLTDRGQRHEAARAAIDALALLPEDRALREMAAAWRPFLEEMRATADIEVLDATLAVGAPASSAATSQRTNVPSASG